jgi:hypothetical protein
MTVWLVPAALILVPAIVGCATALQMSRTLAQAWAATFASVSDRLDQAAQLPRPDVKQATPPASQGGARHSARAARRRSG